MNSNSIKGIYFSPTGTTETVIENIVKGSGIEEIQMIDITLPKKREKEPPEFTNELVIVAVPVYYGRIPELVVPYIMSLKGRNTPVVPVVVYGNRKYDDALKELCDILVSRKFDLVAAGAFIGEHSYSLPGREIACDRPDKDDKEKARAFGSLINKKLKNILSFTDYKGISVPGNHPYKEPANLNFIKQLRKETPLSLTPETDTSRCTLCNNCVKICPADAIDSIDVKNIDKHKCIICFACVKNCAFNAKHMKDPNFNNSVEQLKEQCKERKEPEFFI